MIKRMIRKRVIEAASYFPVVALLGPRQSGKTTLAQIIFPHHRYVNLEDMEMRLLAQNDPKGFLQEFATDHGIIIDEAQYVPQLLSHIQVVADREKKKGFFILTGSQNLMTHHAITQSLAGRIALLTLLPLSLEELGEADLLPPTIETAVFNGGYPRLYDDKVPPTLLFPNYISTYVERDVRDIKNIANLSTFQHFLQLCAGRIGNLVNLTSLGNDCGIDHKTADAWLSVLEATYVIFRLQPYHKNFNKRITKAPKLYFYDTGLACSLLNIKSAEEIYGHSMRGGLIESFCISDLMKQYYNRNQRPRLYFWNDKTREIDCIVDRANSSVPIEIKGGKTMSLGLLSGIAAWKDIAGAQAAHPYLIYGGDVDQNLPQARIIGWKSAGTLIDEIEKTPEVRDSSNSND